MQIEDILSRFESVSSDREGYVMRCSAHSDTEPSLRLFVHDDGKAGFTCRAGCETKNVIDAVDLPWSALFNVTGAITTVPAERPKTASAGSSAALMMWVAQRASVYAGSTAEDYVRERFGVSPEDAARLMLGHASGDGFKYTGSAFNSFPRLVVPFFGFSGACRAAQGRDLSGTDPMRWVGLTNPEGEAWSRYGLMAGAGGFDAVLVTEGPGDALSAVGAGYDAVAIRGASMVNNAELVAELASGLAALGKKIIVCGDNDKAGRRFTRTLSRALADHNTVAYSLDTPREGWDLTDWREDSPDAFPAALHAAVKAAEMFSETKGLLVDAATGALIPSAETAADAIRLIEDYAKRYGTSEVLCASALVAFTGKTIKYADGLGFLVWDGSVWVRSDKRARQQAHFMGASLQMAADGLMDSEKRKRYLSLAAKYMNTRPLDNVMSELKAMPDVQVAPDDFDSKNHLLCFRNGTVDLRTGELGTHTPADLITAMLPYDFDPDAKAPRFERFLTEIFPNHPELPSYMQRMIGYSITGETSEQCFCVFYGKGKNGKSVLTNTLAKKVLKQITKNTPFATFEAKASGGIPNDIAALKDARLVMASEGEAGAPMSEAVLKRITGGDEVTARFMRQEFFTFTPRFSLILSSNHRPKFKGQDEGLWRRVKLIPFEKHFSEAERDPHLERYLIENEYQGIAAWAVRGAVEWYKNGLEDPQSIKDATKDYRENSDALAGFIGHVVEVTGDESDKLLGSDVFTLYLDWCEAENLPQKERWRRTTFYAALEERGVIKRRVSKGFALFGIRVTTVEADDVPEEKMTDTGSIFDAD